MKQVNMSLSGRRWDDDAKAPYFNYKVFLFIHALSIRFCSSWLTSVI